jgi:hypothetical protein
MFSCVVRILIYSSLVPRREACQGELGGAVSCCGCALAIRVNTSCASFRCENSNSVAILPGADSPIEPTAPARVTP